MKCKGCAYFSKGHGLSNGFTHYCIASPDFETPQEYKHLIQSDRVDPVTNTYNVREDDECVSWSSPRFEQESK